jgi:hypothetical protein
MSFRHAAESTAPRANRGVRQALAVRASTLFVASGACLFTMLAVSEEATFKSGEWSVGAERGESGSIEMCLARNRRQDQTPRLYVFMVASDDEAMFSIVGSNWGPWKKDTEVPIMVRIAASYIDADTATAIDGDRAGEQGLILPPGFEQLLAERPDGLRLSVETSKGAAEISVSGLKQVLTELRRCISSDAAQGTEKSQNAQLETSASTILSCKFNDRNAGRSTLSCNDMTGFSLECKSGQGPNTSSTMTVKFDEAGKNIVGRGNVDSVHFSDTTITWREPLGKDDWRVFSVERYSGTITMYGPPFIYKSPLESSREYQRKVENARREGLMNRIATGSCEVVNERRF